MRTSGSNASNISLSAGLLMASLMLPSVCLADTQTPNTNHGAFHETFPDHTAKTWSIAHYAFSNPKFDTDWARERVRIKNGAKLSLLPKTGGNNRFEGASIRRKTTSGYGRYEVTMQPARGEGIVTGFFTYTGPYYGTRHDEIDIEFLGKDTTQLHVAWFVDGKLSNKFIDLGFDAAERPRRYAFDWQPDGIRWYVEDKLVFHADARNTELPQVPSYLFVNLWAADKSIANWSGVAKPDTRATAIVKDVRFIPANEQIVVPDLAQQNSEVRIASRESVDPLFVE